MPLDYENLWQYRTPFNCPECGGHYLQTDAALSSEFSFVEAECTSCGHALTREEIASQMGGISAGAMKDVLAQRDNLH